MYDNGCRCHGIASKDAGLKKISVHDAVGTTLAHDITEVRPGEFKGPSFKRGDVVEEKDLCHLMRLGKNHLYVLDLDENQVHEDDAVLELASALAGPGVSFGGNPSEGKLQLKADVHGLFKVNVEALLDFNMIPDVMAASIHTNTPVNRGESVGATRAIPLVIQRDALDRAVKIAKDHYPILSVKLFNPMKVRLVITGNEVYEGLIQDRFEAIIKEKVERLGATLEECVILPDDPDRIAAQISDYLANDTDMIITTGGMSVDPDDVTRIGIEQAGFEEMHYSSAVLPGAMFLLGYRTLPDTGHVSPTDQAKKKSLGINKDNALNINNGHVRPPDTRKYESLGTSNHKGFHIKTIPIVGVPACGLYHKITIFDLMLPRLLAGEKPGARDLAALSHGGLCLNCPTCRFPACPFGKC
jgi:molybdenum cofactor synthesis domain-containing protein